MTPFSSTKSIGLLAVALLVIASSLAPTSASAQERLPQRQLRAYIPPDQLVSFLPSTPFDSFVELVNPIFTRVTGKMVIDSEGRTFPIGIPVSSVHFLDALEMVLNYNGLVYRETERYFMVEPQPAADPLLAGAMDVGAARPAAADGTVAPATLNTRQVRINAVLFELNHNAAEDSGIDWSVIFGSAGGQEASGGGGQGSENQVSFFLQTEKLFEPMKDVITAPSSIDLTDINSLIRLAESQGVGETIASPEINVQSGVEGRIQIGQDVPVQVRDFAGNTVTQFFSTGIIIEVTPTLIAEQSADSVGSPVVEFIHLDVKVEKSGSRPSAAGTIIDRSNANTQVVMLDGEQVVIGGLFNTEETMARTGVPILKDLPGWFLGLRYIFGRTVKSSTQKELLIVLQAEVIDPIRVRAGRPHQNDALLLRRQRVQDALQRFNSQVQEASTKPTRYPMKREDG